MCCFTRCHKAHMVKRHHNLAKLAIYKWIKFPITITDDI